VTANQTVRPQAAPRWLGLATPRVALLLGVTTLLLVIAAVPLAFLSAANSSGLPLVPFAIVGYVVARRQPQNPIGWILLGLGFMFLLGSDGGSYAYMVYRQGYHLPLARAAAFFGAFWIWLVVLGPLPIALFPDGRASRRWGWVIRSYLVLGAGVLCFYTWQDISGVIASHVRIDNEGALAPTDANGPGAFFVVALFAFWLAAVVKQVVSYRSANRERRQQLKLLLGGAVISIGGLVLGNGGFLLVVALPIAMGVGILRYRLYEIDRLISRTISYAILTGLLVAVFLGIVGLTTRVLPFSSPVGVAASTLAAAALFNPLRLRVQRLVDRRFNRARYDADAIVAAFTLRLRDAVDLDTVRHELLTAVDGAVNPTHASVWIRPPAPRSG
jgi:hypothetical protein